MTPENLRVDSVEVDIVACRYSRPILRKGAGQRVRFELVGAVAEAAENGGEEAPASVDRGVDVLDLRRVAFLEIRPR
jgi:hypothetical protein